MATRAETSLTTAIKQTLADLAPFPGRAATTWRVACVCALVSGVAMLFHIPEAAISVYLVIFLMKPDGAENTIVATAAVIAITILVILMIPLLQATVESALVRILVMIISSFIFIYIGAASKLGEGGSIVGLIIAFILTLISMVPINGVISMALRYAWEMSILPMFCIAGFSLFFGQWSVSLLRQQLRERLMLAQQLLAGKNGDAQEKYAKFLAEGNEDSEKKLLLTKILHQTSKSKSAQIAIDIPASYQLVYASAALAQEGNKAECLHYADQVTTIIEGLDQDKPLTADTQNDQVTSKGSVIQQAINAITGNKNPNYSKSDNDGFFKTDAFTNPVYQQFALKTTLAAIACYMFYSALNWNGIHTAMVTCYVASLGTAGDTVHKLALRISGCLVGAFLGAVSIIYLLPQMETVGGLMVLVFIVCWIAAWVAAGSEKISYAGVQIGLAFTLSVLQGFGPTTDLDTARDRVIGILVGNFAVYLVSVFLWPKTVSQTARDNLVKATGKLADLALVSPTQRQQHIAQIAQIENILADVRYSYYLLPFEPHHLRPAQKVAEVGMHYTDGLSTLAQAIYFTDTTMPEVASRLHRLANHLQNYNLKPAPNPTPPAETVGHYQNAHIAAQLADLEILVTGSSI
ncbi:FUSC family protein [Paenochrobactrum sp. BZR 588]|uniref:FUSC family protein n=1 Tax=Paenochrobactrum TaxID=999488 RepID=UPI0035BBD614